MAPQIEEKINSEVARHHTENKNSLMIQIKGE